MILVSDDFLLQLISDLLDKFRRVMHVLPCFDVHSSSRLWVDLENAELQLSDTPR